LSYEETILDLITTIITTFTDLIYDILLSFMLLWYDLLFTFLAGGLFNSPGLLMIVAVIGITGYIILQRFVL
jgi:hypothetical protein